MKQSIPNKVHFIGIGGISMSALALVLMERGHPVSGSDVRHSPIIDKLVNQGARFFLGQKAENITAAQPELVVYTAAIRKDNPELVSARQNGIPVIDRATLLGMLSAEYPRSIAVAGTHGKTTTTAMLALSLLHVGADPTALVGGELDAIGGNVRIGRSGVFVTEACEYVESFLKLHPYIGIVLNVDKDHLDYFRDLDHIVCAFKRFAARIDSNGALVVCSDSPYTTELSQAAKARTITFGMQTDADWQASNVRVDQNMTHFDLRYHGELVSEVKLKVPGTHNILNALACIATCAALGLELQSVISALESFSGTHRRFEIKGRANGALVVDDYAHHPREIKATLNAARSLGPKRLHVVFQPHTYSRTKTLLNDFASSFAEADQVIIVPIYAAREQNTYGITSQDLAAAASQYHPNVHYAANFEQAAELVLQAIQPGDVVITMGAGNVDQVAELLLR